MSDSTSKTEYIVTYHYKGGGTYIETYDHPGAALYGAAYGMNTHKDYDWYEVKEISTTEKLLKSTKYHI